MRNGLFIFEALTNGLLGIRLIISITMAGPSESGRGHPHSKTSRRDKRPCERASVLECGCPLPLFVRNLAARTLLTTPLTCGRGPGNGKSPSRPLVTHHPSGLSYR